MTDARTCRQQRALVTGPHQPEEPIKQRDDYDDAHQKHCREQQRVGAVRLFVHVASMRETVDATGFNVRSCHLGG
jgi:hypothetical protein